MSLPRVLILAEDCNPEWPSLPIVGYKYALALSKVADVTIATHVRNRKNIEKANQITDRVVYIDNEWIAARMYKFASWLRGNPEVAWSTNQMMAYLPYVFFERQALQHFRSQLDAGDFDLIHRITPMSPTLPSYSAGRTSQPFVIGPLNGNLDWPKAFAAEQKREREMLRKLRGAYRYLPFARRTYRKSAAVLAAFQHTIDDLNYVDPAKIVPFPEIGLDPEIFHAKGRAAPFSKPGPKRFLYAGRLVPYKVPEVAVRGFVESEVLKDHILHVVGNGPELERLQAMVRSAGAQDRVFFEGRKTQGEVADFMRKSDAFIFPSIRELGAGVVIEAMASGITTLVTDYGAPGDLAADGRGVRVPLQPLDDMVMAYRAAMEACIAEPEAHAEIAKLGQAYADAQFPWDLKAQETSKVYKAVLNKDSLVGVTGYT